MLKSIRNIASKSFQIVCAIICITHETYYQIFQTKTVFSACNRPTIQCLELTLQIRQCSTQCTFISLAEATQSKSTYRAKAHRREITTTFLTKGPLLSQVDKYIDRLFQVVKERVPFVSFAILLHFHTLSHLLLNQNLLFCYVLS